MMRSRARSCCLSVSWAVRSYPPAGRVDLHAHLGPPPPRQRAVRRGGGAESVRTPPARAAARTAGGPPRHEPQPTPRPARRPRVGLLAHVCPPAPAVRRENRAPHSARHARLEVPVSLREHHERKPANYWVDAGRTGKDQKARVLHEPQFFTRRASGSSVLHLRTLNWGISQ